MSVPDVMSREELPARKKELTRKRDALNADLAALGRQEEWDEPKGRGARGARPDVAG